MARSGLGEMKQVPYTVLVVEDNEINRRILVRYLESEGYRVVGVPDGSEALRIVRSERADLVILDVVMPGLSGFEVLKALRRLFSAAELPIIMATSRDDSDDVVRAFELGASDYVTKPLDLPVVLARIRAQLRQRPKPRARGKRLSGMLEIQPGTVLGGKYRLEELLGHGNYGVVYRATHLQLRRPVAVKLLRAGFEHKPSTLARFEREGISACRIQHPNAVSVLDFSSTVDGDAFLVMELLEGHSLEQEIGRSAPLSVARCLEVMRPVAAVLAEAHAVGIIHRDVKPHNVFLHRTRHAEVVKVLDFGIAKLVGEAALSQSLTLENVVPGTPAYMAPERISGETYDGRADLYSAGVMLFEMLAGRRPFTIAGGGNAMKLLAMHVYDPPPSLRGFNPAVPPELESLTSRLLEKDPAKRLTAAELARELAEIGVGAVPVDTPGTADATS